MENLTKTYGIWIMLSVQFSYELKQEFCVKTE